MVYVGCSGWYYLHWMGRFYPHGLPKDQWLRYYARYFRVTEVNSTFYRLPSAHSVGRWREETDPGFRFIFKGSRTITHDKSLQGAGPDLEAFAQRIFPLSDRTLNILWQFPPSFKRTGEALRRLEVFCRLLHHFGLPASFEFRDISWYHSSVLTILEDHAFGYVAADAPAFSRHLYIPHTSASLYFRRHGRNGDCYTSYSDQELENIADTVQRHLALPGMREAYVLFNNDGGGHAVQDALRLSNMFYPEGNRVHYSCKPLSVER